MTSIPPTVPVAVVTGASVGLGRALATALADRGWTLVIDGRRPDILHGFATALGRGATVRAVAGDVTDAVHRAALVAAVDEFGRLDLLVNNASYLGPSPQPRLADYPTDELERVFAVDVIAPLALTRLLLPHLRLTGGTVVNVSSDAAVEAYEGWGGYGAAKAALDHASRVLAAEEPGVRVHAFDPGDMRTAMHQQAFPGEDISDRPDPETVVPAFLHLLDGNLAGGRFRAADIIALAPRDHEPLTPAAVANAS